MFYLIIYIFFGKNNRFSDYLFEDLNLFHEKHNIVALLNKNITIFWEKLKTYCTTKLFSGLRSGS